MRNLFIIYLLLFVSSIAWGTRIDDLTVEDSMNLEYCTANTVPYLDASKDVLCSSVTDTELGYLAGVTSLIQTQLDSKLAASGGTLTSGVLETSSVDTYLSLTDRAQIFFREDSGNGTNYVALRAPADISSTFTLNLPDADGSNGQSLVTDGSGNLSFATAGGGGAGTDTNYFSTDIYEGNTTTGFDAYDDGASETPTDGTGSASGNLTISSDTTSGKVIYGSNTIKILQNGGSVQGDGVAIDITEDFQLAGKTRALTVQFSYEMDSAIDADDVCMFVYGDDSGLQALTGINGIGEASHCLSQSLDRAAQFTANFTPSSADTTLKLLFHFAQSPGVTGSLYVDHIFLGEKAVLQAPIVTDWESYTPTYSAALGTTTHTFAEYRRVGDTLSIRGKFTTGTVTTGLATISLPSGLTISTPATVGGGQWHAAVSSTADFSRGTFQIVDAGTTVTMTDDFSTAASSGTAFSAANANVILSSSTVYGFEISDIPITEWANSTNVLSSTQLDVQTPASFANAKVPTGTIGSSFNKATFGTLNRNDNSLYSTANGQWTAPRDGKVFVGARLEFGFSSSVGGETLSVRVVNTTSGEAVTDAIKVDLGLTAEYVRVSGMIEVSKGDVLEVQSWANTTSTTFGSSFGSSNFYIGYQPDMSIVGAGGTPFEVISHDGTGAAVSASNQYHSLSNDNRIQLTPGTWELQGGMTFSRSGANTYDYVFAKWYEADGTDSGTPPTALGTNFTVIGMNKSSSQFQSNTSGDIDIWEIPTASIIVRNTETAYIYLVPYSTHSNSANTRISANLQARRLK